MAVQRKHGAWHGVVHFCDTGASPSKPECKQQVGFAADLLVKNVCDHDNCNDCCCGGLSLLLEIVLWICISNR